MVQKKNVVSHQYIDVDGNPIGGHSFGPGFAIAWQRGAMVDDADGRLAQNGAFATDVIDAVLDRLNLFQATKFKCQENEKAIEHLEQAKAFIEGRLDRRKKEGVEGAMEPDKC